MNPKITKPNDSENLLLTFCQLGNLEAIENWFEKATQIPEHILDLGLLMSCRSYKVLGEHQEIIQLLLNKGASVNAVESESRMSALMIACEKGLNQVVDILLDNKIDVELKDKNGKTAIFYNVQNEHGENSEITLMLAEHKCNFDLTDIKGDSPLLLAINKNYDKSVLIMIKYGASLNIRDKNGNSALHLSVLNENVTITKELLVKGIRNSKNLNNDKKIPAELTQNEQIIYLLDEFTQKELSVR